MIANLARKQAEYETRRRVLDEEFDTREAARRSRFDADTVKHNKMNKEMETSERHREIQRRLVKAMKRTHEKLQNELEQAAYSVDILNERYANQVVEILNSHPPASWVMDRRGSGGNATRVIRDDAVRIITSMTVNPEPMNKTEAWDTINRSAHNQVSLFLFQTCVDLAIMDTETSKGGAIRYMLHPAFLDQLELKPRPRKFQKVQHWYFNRENVFLPTEEERETEYHARKALFLSSAKRKTKDNP